MDKKYLILAILFIVAFMFYNSDYLKFTNYNTFHVMVATGGRPTLKRLLNSLKNELHEYDAITVIFDGRERFNKSGYNDSWIEGFICKVNIIVQEENTGSWGHPIRNKYVRLLDPKTTFIMNADDDDSYYPGSFNKLRKLCTDPNTLYIAKMNYAEDENRIIPKQNKEIVATDIGNPNGIIPFEKAKLGKWENDYLGDYKYYKSLEQYFPKDKIVFLDEIIYRVEHDHSARNSFIYMGIAALIGIGAYFAYNNYYKKIN